MASYNWYEHRENPWKLRFPDGLDMYGRDSWLEEQDGSFFTPQRFRASVLAIEQPVPKSQRPMRVFVSHRQADEQIAVRISEVMNEEGVDFWLDVLDPVLQAAQLLGEDDLSAQEKEEVTATIIEVALLNCSHVLALMTDETPGSMWVPYEFGRVKDDTIHSSQAASWLDPTRKDPGEPEYLLLGHTTRDDPAGDFPQVRGWLRKEKRAMAQL